MDCQAFDTALLDALYDELPEAATTEMDAHAAGCAACSERLAHLERTRETISSALDVPLPAGLEERILASAEAAMPPRAKRTGVIAFLSRPQFAIAATFVLVLGAAALFSSSAKREAAPAAATRSESPAAAAAPAAPPVQATAAAEPAPPAAAKPVASAKSRVDAGRHAEPKVKAAPPRANVLE